MIIKPIIDQKAVISIDWLTFNFNMSEFTNVLLLEELGLKVEFQDMATNVFSKRFYITKNNEKIFTVLYKPHSSAIDKNLAQIQVSNQFLYDFNYNSLQVMLDSIFEKLEAKNVNISRIDICIDFDNSQNHIQKLVDKLNSSKVVFAGRSKDITIRALTTKKFLQNSGLYIGQRSNGRFVRIYNKTLELSAHPKEYIKKRWIDSGIGTDNIWRIEYQLKSDFVRNTNIYNNIDLKKLLSQDSITTLFKLAETNHLELKKNTGKSEINKEKTIPLINYEKIEFVDTNYYRLKKIIEPSTLSQKRTLKAVFREYYASEQNDEMSNMLNYVLHKYELNDYFMQKIDIYLDEFKNMLQLDFKFEVSKLYEHLELAKYDN